MATSSQSEQADQFNALHHASQPLVLFNAWDVASAKAIAAVSPAVATSSQAVGVAAGFGDGQTTPLDLVVSIMARIIAVCAVPVSVDFEAGYSDDPAEVAAGVDRLMDVGAIGINLEDGMFAGKRQLIDPKIHAAKIRAVRQVAEARGINFYINARIDTFINNRSGAPEENLAEAVRRALLYTDAGASGLFVPLLVDLPRIAAFVGAVSLPVNIMAMPGAPSVNALAGVGVRRVSLGGWPMAAAMRAVSTAATALQATGNYGDFFK